MRNCLTFAVRALVPALSLICFMVIAAGLYSLLVTGVLNLTVPNKAQGQLITHENHIKGSFLLLQHHKDPSLFGGRGALSDVKDRTDIPDELKYTSASNLDPYLSVSATLYQIPAVAFARNMPEVQLRDIVNAHIEPPLFGFWGPERINIMRLNWTLASKDKNHD